MKNIYFLLFLFVMSFFSAQKSFIHGKSERVFKNAIQIFPAINEKYYANDIIQDSTKVKDGNFTFEFKNQKNQFYYPYVFMEAVSGNSFSPSSIFYLNSETVKLDLNDKFQVSYSEKKSTISKDFENYKSFFKTIEEQKTEAEKPINEAIQKGGFEKVPQELWAEYEKKNEEIKNNENKLLKEFVQKNPNSVVGFWETIMRFERYGFDPVFEEIGNTFSPQLKKQKPAKIFYNHLSSAKLLNIGATFPTPNLKNIDTSSAVFEIPKGKKYIVVDFWFSHCQPCLEEFPKLKELYSKYNKKGFEIVGIATDNQKFLGHLKSTISEHSLPWKIYWDENSKQANEWTISSFPTKFLLDENGKILQRNISLEDLEKLLQEKL